MITVLALASCDGNHAGEPDSGPVLTFHDAWIRAPFAGRNITAAYCEVTNHGDVPLHVTGFTSDQPGLRVEIHETTEQGGMMRMRPLGRVTISARETVSFAPGGKHLMLFGMDGAAREATLRATLDSGETFPVVFAIRPEAEQ